MARSYSFAPHAEGTQVSFRVAMSPRGGRRLVFPLLRRAIAGEARTNLARLPGAVESQAIAADGRNT